MNAGVASKVFAIVLSDYKSKGVHQYEVSNVKIRSGFGKADINHVPPAATKAADVQRMFGGASVKASPETTDGNTHHQSQTAPESNSSSTVHQELELVTTSVDADVRSGETKPIESLTGISEQDDQGQQKHTIVETKSTTTTENESQTQTAVPVPTQPVAPNVT